MKKTVMFLMVLFVIMASTFIPAGARAEHIYFYKGTTMKHYPTNPDSRIQYTYLLSKSDSILIIVSNMIKDPKLDNVPCLAELNGIWGPSRQCVYPVSDYRTVNKSFPGVWNNVSRKFVRYRFIPVYLTLYDTKSSRIVSFFALSNHTFDFKRPFYVGRDFDTFGRGISVKAGETSEGDKAFEQAISGIDFDNKLWFPPKERYSGKLASLNNNIKDSCYTLTVGVVTDEQLKNAFNSVHSQISSYESLDVIEQFIQNHTGHLEAGLSNEGKICLTGTLLSVNDILGKFKTSSLDFSEYKK